MLAPVTVEQFNNVALSTIEAAVNTAADLISVTSYDRLSEPEPGGNRIDADQRQ